jgi:ER lumen protein retaining receptor
MYLLVFVTRYMDLFLYYISVYNTVFKILFISATSYIIYMIRVKKPYCLGYDPKSDSFNHYLFLYPAVILVTVLFHISNRQQYLYYEYLWSFSVWLEAVAIVPQLYIVYRKREVR